MRTNKLLVLIGMVGCCLIAQGAAIDTDGNAVGLQTDMGDIDMKATKVGDFKAVVAPNYDAVSNAALNAGYITTNGVVAAAFAGYGWPFSEWTVNHPELALTKPTYTNNLWRYTATNQNGTVIGSAHYIESTDGIDAVSLTDTLNGTNIVFSRTGVPVYTNALGLVMTSNLVQYVKHTQLEQTLEGYVSTEFFNNYDASYKMVEGISTENQTIQLVVKSTTDPESLSIQIPQNGRCKDWVVYVLSVTNMPIVLPPADYWIRNAAVTNDIAAGTPTALYFSQVSPEGIYTMGRQEYLPITVQNMSFQTARARIKQVMDSTATKDQSRPFGNHPSRRPVIPQKSMPNAVKPTTSQTKGLTPSAAKPGDKTTSTTRPSATKK